MRSEDSSCFLAAGPAFGVSGGPAPHSAAIARHVFLALLAVMFVAPQAALTLEALSSTVSRDAILDHPLFATELAIATLFWAALCAWPFAGLARSLKKQAEIRAFPEAIGIRKCAQLLIAREHMANDKNTRITAGQDLSEVAFARVGASLDPLLSQETLRRTEDAAAA